MVDSYLREVLLSRVRGASLPEQSRRVADQAPTPRSQYDSRDEGQEFSKRKHTHQL